MKLIDFQIRVLGIRVTGIIAGKKDKWSSIIPKELSYLTSRLYDKVDGDIGKCHGFYMSSFPDYAIVLFDKHDIKSTLLHETSHVYRQIIWDIGDDIHTSNNEFCSILQNYLYDEFLRQMKKHYGFKDKHGIFKPNKKQKKNEIT